MATSTLLITAIAGILNSMFCNAIANFSAAGFINAQCEGTLTGKGKTRLAPASLSNIPARSTASLSPAITV